MGIKTYIETGKTYIKAGLLIAGFAALTSYSIASSEYMDVPGFDTKIQAGRTKNSISTVVAGVVARDLYGDANIELKVKKHFWPDAKLKGYTTKESINAKMDLLLTSATFTANKEDGLLKGEVDKSEFDWKIEQTGPNTYKIARWGPKFDAALELTVNEDGTITGKYVRQGIHFDWHVEGTYDSEGNVEIEIDGPLNWGVTLEGKITPK